MWQNRVESDKDASSVQYSLNMVDLKSLYAY